jgi:hypothetical protein
VVKSLTLRARFADVDAHDDTTRYGSDREFRILSVSCDVSFYEVDTRDLPMTITLIKRIRIRHWVVRTIKVITNLRSSRHDTF